MAFRWFSNLYRWFVIHTKIKHDDFTSARGEILGSYLELKNIHSLHFRLTPEKLTASIELIEKRIEKALSFLKKARKAPAVQSGLRQLAQEIKRQRKLPREKLLPLLKIWEERLREYDTQLSLLAEQKS